jgi:Tol biopolymer transport system component
VTGQRSRSRRTARARRAQLAALLAATVAIAVIGNAAAAPHRNTNHARAGTALSFVRGSSVWVKAGGHTTLLLHGNATDSYSDPAWSPDGRRRLAVSLEHDPDEGTGDQDVLWIRKPKPLHFFSWSGFAGEASWAPDGNRLVYVEAQFADPYFMGGLTIATVPTRRSTVLTQASAIPEDAHDSCPDWSPDGRQIAFARSVGGGTRRLYTIDVKTHRLRRLTAESGQNPSWSPDGRRIVYDDQNTIWVMNADGSHKHTLVTGTDPAWSSDGKSIAYSTLGGIWLMNSDGSGTHGIVSNAQQPAWRA